MRRREPSERGLAQIAAAGLALAAYAALLHHCNSLRDDPKSQPLGALLALMPVTICAVLLLWRSLPRWLAGLSLACFALGLFAVWPRLLQRFSLLNLIEETALYGILGFTFLRSLQRHETPLCTRLADQVHGPLTAHEVVYTRWVTVVWTVFFFAITIVSLSLYVVAPVRLWSIFINFCALPLVAAMFIGEFLVRGWVLPQGRRAGLLASMRSMADTRRRHA